MAVKSRLIDIFNSKAAGPFLFLGSGFSRRYLDLEDWRGLLSRFCVTGKPFEYYLATADGKLPKVATLLAKDFNGYWWDAPEYAASVEINKSAVVDQTSALRIEISNYLSKLNQDKAKETGYQQEIELLANLNVDGVITTNWDVFIEQLFPEYTTYIGQEELLFSNPQEIGEIYKIHGCSTKANSLVLTDSDYDDFNDKNTYLAAKLITLFVEHPIVFIGYSISDENIRGLLKAICNCIGQNNVEKLRQNLIFVQRLSEGEEPNISDTYLTIENVQIPLILIKTNDYAPVYEAIDATKRKIPARVLRYCKEQLYELVQSSDPEKKICVVDIDDIDSKDDVEFLIGVGVASSEQTGPSRLGYEQVQTQTLYKDVLHQTNDLDSVQVLEHVVPQALNRTANVPVFKYLSSLGITSQQDYENSEYNGKLDKAVNRDITKLAAESYRTSFEKKHKSESMEELIRSNTAESASTKIPCFAPQQIDLNLLYTFLVENEEKLDSSMSNYASYFRKLLYLYDRLKWGWVDI